MNKVFAAVFLVAAAGAAHSQSTPAPVLKGSDFYPSQNVVRLKPSTPPAPVRTPGPHYYSLERNQMFGYTDSETGEVHFFQYHGKSNEGAYRLVSFENGLSSLITCSDDCVYATITYVGGTRTFQARKGTVLWSVIQDMVSGKLNPPV